MKSKWWNNFIMGNLRSSEVRPSRCENTGVYAIWSSFMFNTHTHFSHWSIVVVVVGLVSWIMNSLLTNTIADDESTLTMVYVNACYSLNSSYYYSSKTFSVIVFAFFSSSNWFQWKREMRSWSWHLRWSMFCTVSLNWIEWVWISKWVNWEMMTIVAVERTRKRTW